MYSFKSIKQTLIYLSWYYLLMLLPMLIKIFLYDCANRTDMQSQEPCSSRLAIVAKIFFNLPSLLMSIKQGSQVLHKSMVFKTLLNCIWFHEMLSLVLLLQHLKKWQVIDLWPSVQHLWSLKSFIE